MEAPKGMTLTVVRALCSALLNALCSGTGAAVAMLTRPRAAVNIEQRTMMWMFRRVYFLFQIPDSKFNDAKSKCQYRMSISSQSSQERVEA